MQFAPRRFLAVCFLTVIPAFVSHMPAQPGSGTTAAPGASAQGQEPVTHLDTLVVTTKTELPPPENWLTTKIPGFTVYSNAGERASKRLIRDFENFQVALEVAWPIKAAIRRPATLVLCGRGNTFEDFIPRSDRADLARDAGRASITLMGPDRVYIVVDMGTSTMTLNNLDFDIETSFGSATFEVDYFQLLYREYVHYLLSQTGTPPPPWYEEGVLQIIQKMDVHPKYIRIGELRSVPSGKTKKNTGMPIPFVAGDGEDIESTDEDFMPGSETIPDTDFNVALRRRALLGFKDFFGVKADSPLARNPIGNNTWAKQCYAFVHMCVYGWPNKYKKALETLVARSAKEPVTEALFQECFGKSYKKILLELRGYIDLTAYQMIDHVARGKERIDSSPREFTPAPEGESAAMKANALMLANNPGPALPALRGAYGRGERGPDFLAAYGIAARAGNQNELARRILSQAVAAKTTRPAAYVGHARMLLDDALMTSDAPGQASLGPAQLATVLDPLFIARKMRPALPQTYETIAKAWRHSAVAPKAENFGVIREGLMLFPGDMGLVYESAQVLLRMGNTDAARVLATHGSHAASDDAWRGKFKQLLQSSQLAAPQPNPVAPEKSPRD